LNRLLHCTRGSHIRVARRSICDWQNSKYNSRDCFMWSSLSC